MFNASRRACASVPKNIRHQHLTRSITTASRPTIRHGLSNTNRRQTILPLIMKHARSQARHMSFTQRMKYGFREASKGIWRKNPVLLPLAILSVAGAALLFSYIAYVEVIHVGPQYHNFPAPVADALRTAIYYTDVDLNPPKALKAYKEALKIAAELGMHPLSDEATGIKIQVSGMFEKAGLIKPAIEVLERSKVEMLQRIEERRVQQELVEKENKKKSSQESSAIEIKDPEILATQQRLKELEEYEDRQCDKAMKRVVGIQMHLGELYASDYIQDEKKAQEAQEAAVELSMKELHRRESRGLPIGNLSDHDAWLNRTEIAICLSELGDTYIGQANFQLASPLYLRALELIRADEGNSPSCKQAILLTNLCNVISTGFRNYADKEIPEHIVTGGKKMAHDALDIAAQVEPSIRSNECDLACSVANYNLGMIFEYQKDYKTAKKHFKEARRIAQEMGLEDGIEAANEGLERIEAAERKG